MLTHVASAAMPTLSAISDVIGNLLAMPRMPSVPNILRVINNPPSLDRVAEEI